MLKKSMFFVVLAALLLAGCSGTAASSSGAYQTGLSVNGVGEVSLAPDVAYVTIGVHTEAGDVSSAVSQNADQVSSVMAALAGMGVAQEDMQTSNFSLYTGQSYDPFTGQSTGPLYTVDNTVNVTVRDLANMGDLLDGAISAGANSIWGVSFDLDDKTEAQAQARDMAVADAVAEAEALAAAAGVTLGEIQSISYTSESYNYYPYYGMGGGGGDMGGGATSIVPGLITVGAQVYITYAIQ
ncbi:MAG: SIMPL domain-containing protein [Anaerolineales bacterium]